MEDLCSGFLRPEKIYWLQQGLNLWTLDLEASTLPRDHRGQLSLSLDNHFSFLCMPILLILIQIWGLDWGLFPLSLPVQFWNHPLLLASSRLNYHDCVRWQIKIINLLIVKHFLLPNLIFLQFYLISIWKQLWIIGRRAAKECKCWSNKISACFLLTMLMI